MKYNFLIFENTLYIAFKIVEFRDHLNKRSGTEKLYE